ncbi:MAG TPA: maleylpyruvate isomerase N-terminal domain-containing protein [Acidimicrobiia bacterium]|nr:maleylpyruvate isomerase N-terminal domain-containing protein [Acidimicrobiia bacterium]
MDQIEFVPDAVRAAFASAADAYVDVVGRIPASAWDHLALGVWNVRDLAGHASRALVTVSTYLEAGVGKPVEVASPFDYFAVLTSPYADQDEIAERGRQAGRDLGDDPVARVTALRDAALAAVAGASDDAPVASPAGVMRLIDYLPSRIFELTIHTADIARAAGVSFSPDPGATTITFACLASVAVARDLALDALLAIAGRGPLPEGYSAL